MAANKTTALTSAERLEKALVPDNEQPYEVPENWCWTYLTEGFAECLDSFRKPINSTERANRCGNVPYYGATGQVGWIDDFLTDDHLVLVGEDGAPFLDLMKDKAYIVEGKAWVNNHAHILRSFYGTSGNEFLMHYLNIFDFTNYVNGTTRLKLTQASMNTIPVPLAPLAEQKRIVDTIVDLFADLDKATKNAQSIIDNAESRRSAILHQAFTGELTKQWRVENGLDMDSWEETPSSKLFEYVTSGSRGWAQYYSDNGAVFLRMGNLDHGTIELDMSDVQYVNLPEKAEGQRSRVKKGDILISITADVGMIGLVRDIDYEGYINQHVALARPVNTNMAEFIAWYLVSDVGFKQFRQKQRGATKVGLGLADIKSLYLKMPTLAEQREIVRILDELLADEQRIKEAAEETLAKIDLMKKSILADAFRGKLGTNDPSDQPATELLKQILA